MSEGRSKGMIAAWIIIAVVAAVGLLFLSLGDDEAPPTVRKISIDWDDRLLLIEGANLTIEKITPRVGLGKQALFVCPACYDEQHIFADLPRNVEPGTYQLMLFVSRSSIRNREPQLVMPVAIYPDGGDDTLTGEPIADTQVGDKPVAE